jgi:hypothetical protein
MSGASRGRFKLEPQRTAAIFRPVRRNIPACFDLTEGPAAAFRLPQKGSRPRSCNTSSYLRYVHPGGWTSPLLCDKIRLRCNLSPKDGRNSTSSGRIKQTYDFNARPAACNKTTSSGNVRPPRRIKKDPGRNVRLSGRHACLDGRHNRATGRSSPGPTAALRPDGRLSRPPGRIEQMPSLASQPPVLDLSEDSMVMRPPAGVRPEARLALRLVSRARPDGPLVSRPGPESEDPQP